jgi:hypothetical protein
VKVNVSTDSMCTASIGPRSLSRLSLAEAEGGGFNPRSSLLNQSSPFTRRPPSSYQRRASGESAPLAY